MTISIAELEVAAAAGWRAPDEDRIGDWLLRAASGFTGRANSALAVGDPDVPVAVAIDQVLDWYSARELRGMIAVPFPAHQPEANPLDGRLAGAGWTLRSGTATVMTAPTSRVTSLAGPSQPTVDVEPEPDQAWLARYHHRGQALPAVALRLLTSAPWQAFGSIRQDGRTLAIGRVAVSDGWAGITAIEVDPACRRQGLATAVTAALAAVAAARGAGHLYLQVEDDNTGAQALYQRLGFTDHHGYHYRVGPVSP